MHWTKAYASWRRADQNWYYKESKEGDSDPDLFRFRSSQSLSVHAFQILESCEVTDTSGMYGSGPRWKRCSNHFLTSYLLQRSIKAFFIYWYTNISERALKKKVYFWSSPSQQPLPSLISQSLSRLPTVSPYLDALLSVFGTVSLQLPSGTVVLDHAQKDQEQLPLGLEMVRLRFQRSEPRTWWNLFCIILLGFSYFGCIKILVM